MVEGHARLSMAAALRAVFFASPLLLLCGAPAPASAQEAIDQTPEARALADYKYRILPIIHRRMKPIPRPHVPGVAIIQFKVARSGLITSASVVRSSDNKAIDRAALAAVAVGTRLPPFPGELSIANLLISMPMRFVSASDRKSSLQ